MTNPKDHIPPRPAGLPTAIVFYEGRKRHEVGISNPLAVAKILDLLAYECHASNQTWWHHPATGRRLRRNKGEMLMLMVSEISEAMEGDRKDLMDDHLPEFKMETVELADLLIRAFDYIGGHKLARFGAAFVAKRAYNATRADHQAAARLATNGKRY